MSPLLTLETALALRAAREAGRATLRCSLDLERSTVDVDLHADAWTCGSVGYPYPEQFKPRTIYYWDGAGFAPVARFEGALFKLVPTAWGAPTFEIDGIKMLPTAQVSPYADAARKVALIQPECKHVLDTCGGLGYFAAWCLSGGAEAVSSYEKNASVLWLRSLNPWSPQGEPRLTLTQADIGTAITALASASIDAVLHDPPRFGIAGELYSQLFYDELARVLRRRGRLFHYTGSPNKLTSGRDVPTEVSKRLQRAGFRTVLNGDGVLATKR